MGIKFGDASENTAGLDRKYTLVVNGGTVTGDSYGISGNGLRHGSEVTITGGKVQGDAAGIFQPQDGVLNIKGTAVVEGGCGVEIRAGEINVSENALIQATDDYATPVANGSGTTMQGVALAVSPHDTGKDLKVNITGGTFEATGSNGLSFCENDTTAADSSEKVTLSVSGGTFLKGFETENFNTDDRGGYVTGGIHHVDLYDTMVDPNTLFVIEDEASPIGYVGNAAKTRLANAPANTALVVVQAKAGAELAVAPGVILTNDSGVTIKVNGKTLSDDTLYTVPGISAEPIPETGDGMGLFVFAGLALISMLGMVAMKKREEY